MLITTRGRYAVRIMLDIALNRASAVRISEISARQGITPKYAEQITGLLVKAGLLRSARGANGGYFLVKEPSEYKISEILFRTEGDLAPAECVSEGGSCARTDCCAIRTMWDGLYRTMRDYLDGITLADLACRAVPCGDDYSI
ncbi:MAG: Rrf2 family transcriptional regulator [Clostridia bacterium]|nr:Rrf2 family transcriptional regulator [Clostridia bacterium]